MDFLFHLTVENEVVQNLRQSFEGMNDDVYRLLVAARVLPGNLTNDDRSEDIFCSFVNKSYILQLIKNSNVSLIFSAYLRNYKLFLKIFIIQLFSESILRRKKPEIDDIKKVLKLFCQAGVTPEFVENDTYAHAIKVFLVVRRVTLVV